MVKISDKTSINNNDPVQSVLYDNVNEQDSKGWAPLHHAAAKREIASINSILKKPEVNLNLGDSYGWTPLHIASFYGHKDVILLLCERGANPNSLSWVFQTPLDVSQDSPKLSAQQKLEVKAVLCRHGASPLVGKITKVVFYIFFAITTTTWITKTFNKIGLFSVIICLALTGFQIARDLFSRIYIIAAKQLGFDRVENDQMLHHD